MYESSSMRLSARINQFQCLLSYRRTGSNNSTLYEVCTQGFSGMGTRPLFSVFSQGIYGGERRVLTHQRLSPREGISTIITMVRVLRKLVLDVKYGNS